MSLRLEPFALERYFARYEFCTRHLLSCSDAESWSVRELLTLEPGAQEALLELRLGYTESAGAPDLRRAIAGLYEHTGPEQVLVCAGAQEAIFLFMTALFEPGDRVVVMTPCYQSLYEVPRALGCLVVRWDLQPGPAGWQADFEGLARLMKGARALVVNSPHNPTGAHFTAEQQTALVELCRRSGAWLFFDEVYRELEHRPEDLLPAACDLYERAVSLGVTSKSYGLAGLRIGWMALRDADLYQRMAARKDYTSLCASAPSEQLAALALRHRHRLLERNRRLLLENLAVALPEPWFEWLPPRAGPVAFPRVRIQDVEGWCHRLAEQGVLLVPGALFGHPGHVRVGLGRAGWAAGVKALRGCLEPSPA